MRDDFYKQTKDTLAKRVRFMCSNPDCEKITIGPNTHKDKTTNVGVAAHIKAASVGGKRFDQNQTPEDRSSIENGIWLCQTCSKLIDSDENYYTCDLLLSWKTKAEEKASSDVKNPTINKINYTNTGNSISNLELKVLKILYIKYKNREYPRNNIIKTYKELDIIDGTYVGTLNDSKYIKINGEDFLITSDGIRHMDSLTKEQLNAIVLPEEQKERGKIIEKQKEMFEKNAKNSYKNSSK